MDRLAIAFFLGPRLDSHVPVLSLPPELAAQVCSIAPDPLNPVFHDVGKNWLKSRVRSHPDVAERYHADVVGLL